MSHPPDAYRAVAERVALIDRSGRGRLEVSGPDRARFLHNLTTNDVKRLAAGKGQEAFVTSPQGKTLGYLVVLAADDRILLRGDDGAWPLVLPHLEKYGVFDDVAVDDVGGRTFELHLAGPGAEALLEAAGGVPPPPGELSHHLTEVGGVPVRAIRESPTGRPGLSLIGDRAGVAAVTARLRLAGEGLGLVDLPEDLFEVLRIEAGTPVFGADVTADNLPQEVGRDDRAICFVKGCYLGQETVARIDALGHVNKHLKGLRLATASTRVTPGTPIEGDGKVVGSVTSAADSPGWGETVALGYVRSTHVRAGTAVRVRVGDEARDAVVCDLPMLPPTPV